MKSREQKLADMRDALEGLGILGAAVEEDGGAFRSYIHPADLVERLLDAAEREEPAWPNPDSLYALRDSLAAKGFHPHVHSDFGAGVPVFEAYRVALRAAFLADPIIQQVIALSHTSWDHGETANGVARLLRTARDAGLLDGTEGK